MSGLACSPQAICDLISRCQAAKSGIKKTKAASVKARRGHSTALRHVAASRISKKHPKKALHKLTGSGGSQGKRRRSQIRSIKVKPGGRKTTSTSSSRKSHSKTIKIKKSKSRSHSSAAKSKALHKQPKTTGSSKRQSKSRSTSKVSSRKSIQSSKAKTPLFLKRAKKISRSHDKDPSNLEHQHQQQRAAKPASKSSATSSNLVIKSQAKSKKRLACSTMRIGKPVSDQTLRRTTRSGRIIKPVQRYADIDWTTCRWMREQPVRIPRRQMAGHKKSTSVGSKKPSRKGKTRSNAPSSGAANEPNNGSCSNSNAVEYFSRKFWSSVLRENQQLVADLEVTSAGRTMPVSTTGQEETMLANNMNSNMNPFPDA